MVEVEVLESRAKVSIASCSCEGGVVNALFERQAAASEACVCLVRAAAQALSRSPIIHTKKWSSCHFSHGVRLAT